MKTYAPESPPPAPDQSDLSHSVSPADTWNSRNNHHHNNNTREVDRVRVRQDVPNSGKLQLIYFFDFISYVSYVFLYYLFSRIFLLVSLPLLVR